MPSKKEKWLKYQNVKKGDLIEIRNKGNDGTTHYGLVVETSVPFGHDRRLRGHLVMMWDFYGEHYKEIMGRKKFSNEHIRRAKYFPKDGRKELQIHMMAKEL